MKLTCYILDDEPLAIRVLQKYVEASPVLQYAGSSTNPLTALQELQQKPVDLLFLDINMPELRGTELARLLKPTPLFIFTTAYTEFAAEGFELDAVDYLVKPISEARFSVAVQKAIRNWHAPAPGFPPAQEQHEFLSFRADRRQYRIPLSEINYMMAMGDYTRIFTASENYMCKQTLTAIMEQLPASLFRQIHRSYAVAIRKVRFIEGNQVGIEDQLLPIGKNYRDSVVEWWGD